MEIGRETGWTKSSLSASGDCVEWRIVPEEESVCVRDSKDPDGGTLTFTFREWRAFTGGVRLGEAEL